MDGVYTYCFGNQMSTMTPKVVMFSMEVIPPGAPAGTGDASPNPSGLILSLAVFMIPNYLAAYAQFYTLFPNILLGNNFREFLWKIGIFASAGLAWFWKGCSLTFWELR